MGSDAQPNRRAAARKKKRIIVSVVAAVFVIALIITLIVVFKKVNTPEPTITTSYQVKEVTVGDVSTTISGSGVLTPITQETLTVLDLIEDIEETEEEAEEEEAEKEVEDTNDDGGATPQADLAPENDSDAAVIPQTPAVVVGGIGIMNIMLVSVSERTKEIGIRKAVGAKRRHIMFQFLCEACVLSVLGGLIGLGLSFGGIQIYNIVSGASATMNWAVGGAAIAFCAVIGIAFGSYPAAKASRLQPIDALHNS